MDLKADKVLSSDDFFEHAKRLGRDPFRAKKTGRIAARQAEERQTVETRWSGLETTNQAAVGDWIVTALGEGDAPLRDENDELNVYVISASKFPTLYERDTTAEATEFGALYEPKGEVVALELPNGFDILAPWGERQRADSGYLLLNGVEVYGNHKDTFEATYRRI